MITTRSEYLVHLKEPHDYQRPFVDSTAKRKIIRAGRRSGKTVGIGIHAVLRFLDGKRRVLYAAPTVDQTNRFWSEISLALREPIEAGIYYKNETEHIVEVKGTENRIRAKTAWNADTLRGDYADELILDEWQLMDEEVWEVVGAPMLLDNDGNATFIYTPPSLHSRSVSKARDPQHAAKMYKKFDSEMKAGNPRYFATTFSSHENPYISKEALGEITKDMTSLSYRMEILAQDVDEAPGALWNRHIIEDNRVIKAPDLSRIVVAIDPSTTSGGDEAGIITAGMTGDDFYTLSDDSLQASPKVWAETAVMAYHKYKADCIVAESNNGGEMVKLTIETIPEARGIPIRLVHASRGKQIRAEPIAAIFEQKRGHMVGSFPSLEDELCLWIPGDNSPNRLDAMVWGLTYLMTKGTPKKASSHQG